MKEKELQVKDLQEQNHQLVNANLQYQQILEKTNNQVALWSNPYAVMVSVLGVLFTIFTIAAAVFIWWQSREHRKMIKEELDKIFIERQKNALELIEKTTKESQEKLDSATGETKAELKDKIKVLKDLEFQVKTGVPDFSQYMKKEDYLCDDCKNSENYGLGLWSANLNSRYSFIRMGNKKCIYCGKKF